MTALNFMIVGGSDATLNYSLLNTRIAFVALFFILLAYKINFYM